MGNAMEFLNGKIINGGFSLSRLIAGWQLAPVFGDGCYEALRVMP